MDYVQIYFLCKLLHCCLNTVSLGVVRQRCTPSPIIGVKVTRIITGHHQCTPSPATGVLSRAIRYHTNAFLEFALQCFMTERIS